MQACLSAIDAYYHCPALICLCRTLLHHILKNNVFCFNGVMYRQQLGTAMGTAMAPNFSNIFMARLEEAFLSQETVPPTCWFRYIDDISMVWNASLDQLDGFLTRLNEFHPTIKFTHECDAQEAVFLDTHISKGNRFRSSGILDIRTHFKPTNRFQYVHYTSDHTRATEKAVVIGKCTRFLRSTSDRDTYHSILRDHVSHLVARGYPRHFVTRTIYSITISLVI